MSRVVVWFSCGAASACAAKLAVEKYGNRTHVVYCNTLSSEHPDNTRFFSDVEKWIGQSIEIIGSEKYRDVDDVFEKTRYMSGIKGARCTQELKRLPREDYQEYTDIHIFGLTSDELRRISRFEANNPNLNLEWILRDTDKTKVDCYTMISEAGIALPIMYSLGFKNNNCIGCVKATSPAYWEKIRQHFPETFERRCQQSRKLGVRLARYHGERIFLDELPQTVTDQTPEQDIECGPICLIEKEES